MSLHYRHEGRFPAVITAMGEQMANNMDCGHPAWPLGTSTLLGCSVAKSAWGKLFLRILRADIVSVHPLKAPMAFTHLLPGASRRRVAAPPSLPRHHTLLLMCQQTQESSGYPLDGHPCLPGIYGPSQRGIRFIKRSKDCKREPKQENEANVGLARNIKLCPLLRASAHSCLSTYLSTLAITESASTLPSTQPFPAKWTLLNQRGLQIFPGWL